MELGAMFARSFAKQCAEPKRSSSIRHSSLGGISCSMPQAAYSKLCTEKNLRTIDAERGFFVTVVPKTRSEVETFTDAVLAGDVRWEEILRKRADRDEKAFDVIECAVGPYHLREGFMLHWYRSSQKKKRDENDRNERIERAIERLEALDLKRMRGPKTDAAIRSRVDLILAQHRAEEWVTVDIKWDSVEHFKAVTRGKPTAETAFRRFVKKEPRLHVKTNPDNIARSQVTDGIFPLTTNTKEKPVEVGSKDEFGGPAAERTYLDSLRDSTGKPVQYQRLGSVGSGPDGHILDLYEITTSTGVAPPST